MPDMAKVIKGLEQFKADFKPFCGNNADWERVDDAIALLKEQEAEKPTWSRGKPFCGACGLQIRSGGKFCSECGKPIAWEGR